MHCVCCDKMLTDYEATRRNVNTNEFVDMCNKCYATIANEVLTLDRQDLKHEDEDDIEGLLYEDNTLDGLRKRLFDND